MNRAMKMAQEIVTMKHVTGVDAAVVSYEPNSAWQTDDREWFGKRAVRGYRLRRAHENEAGIHGHEWVLVKQIEEGSRVRIPLAWVGEKGPGDMFATLARLTDVPSQDGYYDLVLALIWQGVVERKWQPIGVVLAQADALQSLMPSTRQ